MVGDPLQVCDQFQGRGQVAQIAGDWLLPGDDLDTAAIDLALHLVDHVIIGNDPLSPFRVEVGQGLDSFVDRLLHMGAHPDDFLMQIG